MQATVSSKGFGFGRFGGSLAALGLSAAFAAGIATGIAGEVVVDEVTNSSGAPAAIVQPKAHYVAQMGEGLVANDAASAATLKAHYVAEMGEGRLNADLTAAATLKAYDVAGQGNGIVGGHESRDILTAPVTAHTGVGQGEGWITQGRPATTLHAYPSEGQGEGWIANGRP